MREGYGQTECLIATSSSPCDHSGSIGPPGIYNEIRLIDVPDMKYFGDKGEILIRGDNVMKGYFKNEAKTRETVDEDGWLHTGDIEAFDLKDPPIFAHFISLNVIYSCSYSGSM